jgi:SAM-dependent methyltransferase
MNLSQLFSYGFGKEHRFKKIASFCFGKTLDIGCALGGNKFIPSPVAGFDIRPLSQWQVLSPNYTKRVIGDATKLKFKKEFDCITASELIEHLRDPYGFLLGCYDALKDGGRLILSTDNPYRIQTMLANAFSPKGLGGASSITVSEYGHVNFMVPRMLNYLAEDAGFRVVAVECGEGLPLPFLQQKLVYVYQKGAR